uniref:Innexin n=1 Tax=Acrobeloides nanus TaxID=290746 RepID=A0A914C4U7_9BILA
MLGGKPIECWLPAEYKDSWEDYTEIYCWARNTYWVSFHANIPVEEQNRENHMISYYQWTPFFLVICAFMFYFPCLIWRLFYDRSGRIFLMNRFLQTDDYSIYGLGVLKDILMGKPWSESGNFPRVTYCDMDIRILGNVQKHTVQCVLVINIFTEKVFILLWIWYTVLALVSATSLFSWAYSSFPFIQRKRFILRRLELADIEFNRKNFKAELDKFVRDYVKMDGVFVLKMLTIHSGILVCTEVVDVMWDAFLAEIGKYPLSEDELKKAEIPGSDLLEVPRPPPRRKISVLVPLLCKSGISGYRKKFSAKS